MEKSIYFINIFPLDLLKKIFYLVENWNTFLILQALLCIKTS